MEAFDAPFTAPAMTMPDGAVEAAPAARPALVRGDEPLAAVLLVEIDVQGLVEAV